MSDSCPLPAKGRLIRLKALEKQHNIGKTEIESILTGWDGMTYDEIDEDLNKIEKGGYIKEMVKKRKKEEGAEKAGKLWEYMECKDAYYTVKARTLGPGGRRRRRRSTKKKRRKRNLKKRTGLRRRKSKRRRRR